MKIKGFKHQWTIYFLPLFTLGIVLTFMNSCSSEEQNELAQVKKSQFYVISNLSVQEYNALTLKINNFIKFSSRSNGNEVTETEAQELLKPLINDGYNIQRQIISNTEDLGLTFEETENIQNFTDDQLAELSFLLNTICSDASAKGVSFNDIIDCLSRALGIDDVKSLIDLGVDISQGTAYYNGTKMLMNATTMKKILKAVGLRTYGMVGVIFMVYDFTDCINSK